MAETLAEVQAHLTSIVPEAQRADAKVISWRPLYDPELPTRRVGTEINYTYGVLSTPFGATGYLPTDVEGITEGGARAMIAAMDPPGSGIIPGSPYATSEQWAAAWIAEHVGPQYAGTYMSDVVRRVSLILSTMPQQTGPTPIFNIAPPPPTRVRLDKIGDNAVVKQSPRYPNQWWLWVRQVFRFSDGTQGYDPGLGWYFSGNVLKTDVKPENFLSLLNWEELSANDQAEIAQQDVTGTGGQAGIPETTVNGVPISQVPPETFSPAPVVPEILRATGAPTEQLSATRMGPDSRPLALDGAGASKKGNGVNGVSGKAALPIIVVVVLLALLLWWASRR